MQEFRRMGPRAVAAYLAQHAPGPSAELDALCAQKDADTTLLYWFTDLDAAITEARRTRRPILSLRLLGRLDEELSCANSRFFRKLLYPEPRINALLRDRFVLHWQSVRPVPRMTIDFGDGRRVERTITGNSAHLVLDSNGRPVDALPGLFAADVFVALLERALVYAAAPRHRLAALHQRALLESSDVPATREHRAVNASRIAMTKHMVEAPTLRAALPPSAELDADTRTNLELHARVHAAFAQGLEWSSIDAMVDRIYSDLFQMPLDDATLGLDVPDPFTSTR